MPEVFQDPLVQRSSYWALSTSAIFSKHFGPYGWGEARPTPPPVLSTRSFMFFC